MRCCKIALECAACLHGRLNIQGKDYLEVAVVLRLMAVTCAERNGEDEFADRRHEAQLTVLPMHHSKACVPTPFGGRWSGCLVLRVHPLTVEVCRLSTLCDTVRASTISAS